MQASATSRSRLVRARSTEGQALPSGSQVSKISFSITVTKLLKSMVFTFISIFLDIATVMVEAGIFVTQKMTRNTNECPKRIEELLRAGLSLYSHSWRCLINRHENIMQIPAPLDSFYVYLESLQIVRALLHKGLCWAAMIWMNCVAMQTIA